MEMDALRRQAIHVDLYLDFAAYGLARLFLFGPLRRASKEKIVFAARQESELLESVRGAMPVKLANKQDERLARYANATVATANSDVSIQRLGIAFSVVNHLLFGLGRIALVWLAAAAALRNEFTAGMLVAPATSTGSGTYSCPTGYYPAVVNGQVVCTRPH